MSLRPGITSFIAFLKPAYAILFIRITTTLAMPFRNFASWHNGLTNPSFPRFQVVFYKRISLRCDHFPIHISAALSKCILINTSVTVLFTTDPAFTLRILRHLLKQLCSIITWCPWVMITAESSTERDHMLTQLAGPKECSSIALPLSWQHSAVRLNDLLFMLDHERNQCPWPAAIILIKGIAGVGF